MNRVVVWVGALVALSCGGGEGEDVAVVVESLAERGEFSVGYRTMDVVYDRPDGEGERSLELLVWYPSRDVEGDLVRYAFRRSDAFADARPAAGPFPVFVFSHGHQAIPDAATDLAEHFASHGWLVLSPEHTGNTTADGGARFTWIYYLRPHDLSASLDHVLALPAGDPLHGLAGDRVVVGGHSFGGYTAYAAAGASYVDMQAGCDAGELNDSVCSEMDADAAALFAAGFHDERFQAVIAMAAGDQGLFEGGVADVDVPVFQMVAEGDGHPSMSAGMDAYWQALDGPDDVRFDLLGAAHNSFTDTCLLVALRCPEDPFDDQAEADLRLVRTYALAFARRAVLGEDRVDALLDGSFVVDARVEIDAR